MSNNSDRTGRTTVVINSPPTNGLGTAGFITAILSWFTCGFLMPFALLISVLGLFKAPRGMAIAGVILSSLAVIPLVLIAGVFGVGLSSAGKRAGVIVAGVKIVHHHEDYGSLPDDTTGQQIVGDRHEYTLISDTAFRVCAAGANPPVCDDWSLRAGGFEIVNPRSPEP